MDTVVFPHEPTKKSIKCSDEKDKKRGIKLFLRAALVSASPLRDAFAGVSFFFNSCELSFTVAASMYL